MLGSNKWQKLSRKSTATTVSLLSQVNRFIIQGQHQLAIELLEKSVSDYPHDSSLLSTLGRLYLRAKQPDKAVIYLRRALSEFNSASNHNDDYCADEFSNADAAYIDELAAKSSNGDFSVLDELEDETLAPAQDLISAEDKGNSSHTLRLKSAQSRKAKVSVKQGTNHKVTVIRKGRKRNRRPGSEDSSAFTGKPNPDSEQIKGNSGTPCECSNDRNKATADTERQPEGQLGHGSRCSARVTTLTGYADHTVEQLTFDYDDISDNDDFDQQDDLEVVHLEIDEDCDDYDDELDGIDPDTDLVDSLPLDDDFSSEDFGWDDLDDFEEDASRESEDEELAQTKLTRAERARQVAVEVLERLGWDREYLPLLGELFLNR